MIKLENTAFMWRVRSLSIQRETWRRLDSCEWPLEPKNPDLGSAKPLLGLPRWLRGKESAWNAGDTRDVGLISGSGRSPGGGNGNPFQYSCLENPMDRGAWQRVGHNWINLAHTHSWEKGHLPRCTHTLYTHSLTNGFQGFRSLWFPSLMSQDRATQSVVP